MSMKWYRINRCSMQFLSLRRECLPVGILCPLLPLPVLRRCSFSSVRSDIISIYWVYRATCFRAAALLRYQMSVLAGWRLLGLLIGVLVSLRLHSACRVYYLERERWQLKNQLSHQSSITGPNRRSCSYCTGDDAERPWAFAAADGAPFEFEILKINLVFYRLHISTVPLEG